MHSYIFSPRELLAAHPPLTLRAVLGRVAADTPTDGLVVAVYLHNGHSHWKGYAVGAAQTHAEFGKGPRGWAFVKRYSVPDDLPESYHLIRMSFGMATVYPETTTDAYGWEWRCPTFLDLLAMAFAHELHHYRRHCLGMHHGEGEQSACRWALARVTDAGFRIKGRRVATQRSGAAAGTVELPATSTRGALRKAQTQAGKLDMADLKKLRKWVGDRIAAGRPGGRAGERQRHYERLRALPDGAVLKITNGSKRYVGQAARKTRTLRRNSARLEIQTSDGEVWRWPMEWLSEM
jgi:hypothetical protein